MTAAGMEAVKTHPDTVAALDAIRWTRRVSWPSARALVDLVIESLPFVESDFDADLIEHLALAIEDLRDEARALRTTLLEAVAVAHEQHQEIVRLRRVYHAAVNELRVLRQQLKADA